MTDGTGTDVGLCHGTDLQRCLHADIHALLLQDICHGHAVHGGGQHAHVVGTGALNVALAILHAAPEVAAADDDAHLYAHLHTLADHIGNTVHHIKIEAELLLACQRFAADLQQHTFIFRLVHSPLSLRIFVLSHTAPYFTLFLAVCLVVICKIFSYLFL